MLGRREGGGWGGVMEGVCVGEEGGCVRGGGGRLRGCMMRREVVYDDERKGKEGRGNGVCQKGGQGEVVGDRRRGW